ncbi:ABC transporter permease [Paenibacillus antibioticophila]|uniref:ABC transporter permease n=1 Tax=Paenibacillus antibioticophila TaxID=1274374 RepID=UPI0005CAA7BF|nr:ABC transporter permease [Paenibacillus antibioticophila]
MNVLNPASYHYKKSKSTAVFLFILIMIAGLLMNLGLSSLTDMDGFYADKVRELHDPHVSITMNSASYKAAYRDFLSSYPGVQEVETERVILLSSATIPFYKYDLGYGIRTMVLDADAARNIAPVKLIEAASIEYKDGIYIPYTLKVRGGYELGDNFPVTYRDKQYTYRVAGFFESTLMGTPKLDMLKLYLSQASYLQLSKDAGPAAQGTLMSAILTDSEQSGTLLMDYYRAFPQSNETVIPGFWAADTHMAEDGGAFIVYFVSLILVVFAAVMVLVSLLVIKFRVTDRIETGMVGIGVLKAMGYTRLQIVFMYVVPFIWLAFAASVAGVAVSCAVMPLYGNMVSALAGLVWNGSAHAVFTLACVGMVTFLVFAVAYLSAAPIYRLHPVEALRGGIKSHNFKRNYLPLSRTRGGVHWLLACKTTLAAGRQNLLLGCIMAAVTFASVFSVILYYNTAMDKTALFRMLGSETPDVGIQVESGVDSLQLLAAIRQMAGVNKAILMESIPTVIQGQNVSTEIIDQFEYMDNQTVYEGRYPLYDNEIAVTGKLAGLLGKTIGDSIKVEAVNGSYIYLITGLNQSFSAEGKGASLTLTGVNHLIPGLKGMSINVYLQEGSKTAFMQEVQAEYGNLIRSLTDVNESKESGTQVYGSALLAVMTVILSISVLVVVLILFLVIKTSILKRRRDVGILKVAGYTSFQLIAQLTLSIIPVTIAGVVAGGALGALYTNAILELLLADAGISRVRFIVPMPYIAMLCTVIVAFSCLVSLFVARRIKGVTPYVLITE